CQVMVRPVMATACKGEVLFWRREERVVMIQSDGGETERIQIEAHLGLESGHRIFPCAPEDRLLKDPRQWLNVGRALHYCLLADRRPPFDLAHQLPFTLVRIIPLRTGSRAVEPLAQKVLRSYSDRLCRMPRC